MGEFFLGIEVSGLRVSAFVASVLAYMDVSFRAGAVRIDPFLDAPFYAYLFFSSCSFLSIL